MRKKNFLQRLNKVVAGETDVLFPCIQDLVTNGLVLSRFTEGTPAPNRQDVTHYLAAWFRFAGLEERACRDWLVVYCVDMLASMSKTSPSGIRHSTKSVVRYIYRSGVPFACQREENRFKAACHKGCPAYEGIPGQATAEKTEVQAPTPLPRMELPAIPIPPVKDVYRDQFEVAMDIIMREVGKGTTRNQILEILHQQGLKTRTGRKWNGPTLSREIKEANENT